MMECGGRVGLTSGLEKRMPLKKVSRMIEKLIRSSKLVTFRANGDILKWLLEREGKKERGVRGGA